MQPRLELHLRRVLAALERLWVIAVMEADFWRRGEALATLALLGAGTLLVSAATLWIVAQALRLIEPLLLVTSGIAVVLFVLDWLNQPLPPR